MTPKTPKKLKSEYNDRIEIIPVKKLTDKEAYFIEMELSKFMIKLGFNCSVDVRHFYNGCPSEK